MGFSVVHDSPQTIWVPVLAAQTIYTGSIVAWDTDTPLEGVSPYVPATGHNNTTAKDVPFGIVVGNNNISANVNYSSTYKAEYITAGSAGSSHGSTTKFANVEGPWAKGDPLAMVEVAVINPSTVIRGPLFNAAVGTAPTVVTVSSQTTGGGTGVGCTTGSSDVATVANFGTIYFRSGANTGAYRTVTSASATAHTWLQATKEDVSVGDTAVVINGLRTAGMGKFITDTTGLYVDINGALTSHNNWVNILRLDLSTAGKEYVEFQFNADNFNAFRT